MNNLSRDHTALLNVIPVAGNISNTGTLGALIFVFIYSITVMISKIALIQTLK